MRIQHVALHVPDLEEAEAYYQRVLGLESVTREALDGDALTDDAGWAQLPHTAGWDDAKAAGIEIRMVGLRRDELHIALFPGTPTPGTVFLIGVVTTPEEIAEIRSRLPSGTPVEVDEDAALTFVDPYAFRWQLSGPGFIGPGDARGAWLHLGG